MPGIQQVLSTHTIITAHTTLPGCYRDSLELSDPTHSPGGIVHDVEAARNGSPKCPMLGQPRSLSQETPDRCDYLRQYPRRETKKTSVAIPAMSMGNRTSILTQAHPTGCPQPTLSPLVGPSLQEGVSRNDPLLTAIKTCWC